MKFLPRKKHETGQTLIIILLVIAVSLVVGAGIATRSVSVVQQTTFTEEAAQSLHFAEACAEEALGKIKLGNSNPQGITQLDLPCGNLEWTAGGKCPPLNVDGITGNDCCYEVSALGNPFPGVVAQDDAVELKTGSDSDFDCSEVDIYWCAGSEGDQCANDRPALEVIVISDSGIRKEIYGSDADGFALPGYWNDPLPGETIEYAYKVTLRNIVPGADKAVRFIPRFRDSHIAVRPASGQPADCLGHQGYHIVSEGTFGRSTRRIEVTKTEPAMPAIFDYSIFSGSSEPLEKR